MSNVEKRVAILRRKIVFVYVGARNKFYMPCLRANSWTFGDLRKSQTEISKFQSNERLTPRGQSAPIKNKNRIRVCVIPSTSPRQIRTCSRYDDWSTATRKTHAVGGTARLQVHTRLPLTALGLQHLQQTCSTVSNKRTNGAPSNFGGKAVCLRTEIRKPAKNTPTGCVTIQKRAERQVSPFFNLNIKTPPKFIV